MANYNKAISGVNSGIRTGSLEDELRRLKQIPAGPLPKGSILRGPPRGGEYSILNANDEPIQDVGPTPESFDRVITNRYAWRKLGGGGTPPPSGPPGGPPAPPGRVIPNPFDVPSMKEVMKKGKSKFAFTGKFKNKRG